MKTFSAINRDEISTLSVLIVALEVALHEKNIDEGLKGSISILLEINTAGYNDILSSR